MNFAVGDVVTLKSGSPRLTIIKIVDQTATCVCFRQYEVKIFEFPFAAIEPLVSLSQSRGRWFRLFGENPSPSSQPSVAVG